MFMKRLTIYIPDHIWEIIRNKAEKEGRSFSNALVRIIEICLEKTS